MISVQYKYRNAKQLKTFSCPTSLVEMSIEQMQIYYQFLVGDLQNEFALVPVMWLIPLKDLNKMDEEMRYLLYNSFLKNIDNSKHYFIPTYKTFESPLHNMQSSPWHQYYMAHHYLETYKEHKKPIDFHKFLATLYTPQGERFRMEQVEENYRHFVNAPSFLTFSSMISFASITEQLTRRFPHVYQKGKVEIGETTKSSWLEVSLSMCENDPVRLSQMNEQNMYLVLKAMDQKLVEFEKNKPKK